MNNFFCVDCGKKLQYHSDPNPIYLAWSFGLSSHALVLFLNRAYDLPHRIMRRDLKGFWYCEKKNHYTVIFDVKRYKRKFIFPNESLGLKN